MVKLTGVLRLKEQKRPSRVGKFGPGYGVVGQVRTLAARWHCAGARRKIKTAPVLRVDKKRSGRALLVSPGSMGREGPVGKRGPGLIGAYGAGAPGAGRE